MALLETYPVGTTVKIAENGTLAEYLIVHIGLPDSMYDVSCDGIWMLRKDIFEKRQWHSSDTNNWANSTLKAYLDSTFLNRFDANVKNVVKTVKIPYRPGSGASMTVSSGANGLSCKVFLLSGYEVGFTTSVSQYFPVDGAKLSYFIAGNGATAQAKRVANLNGSAFVWLLRSPYAYGSTSAWRVIGNGDYGSGGCSSSWGVRPALVLPYNRIRVNDDGTLTVKPPATLGELGIKDKVAFGKIYDKPIVWEVGDKNHEGYPDNSVSLVTAQIIKILSFDAKEPGNSNADRKNYGNNRYIYSNIRQWLNSDADAGTWYIAQHSADAPPNRDNLQQGDDPYDTFAGFLNPFTETERLALLPTTLVVGKNSVDGGGTETCVDKVFLLSCAEISFDDPKGCGNKWAIFSDDASRIATVTASCVDNSEFWNKPVANAAWFYWLRNPYNDTNSDVFRVQTTGEVRTGSRAYGSGYGLRPACNLSADTPIVLLADGTYAVVPMMPKATGDLPVGALVNAQFADGTSKQCIAVNQGIPEDSALYDVSCNGTWMLFKDCTESRQWNSTDVNDYENSTIHAYLNGEFIDNLEGEFSKNILQVKIPYRPGSGTSPTINSGANGLSCKVFPLSGYEVGFTTSINQYFPVDGAKLSYFIAGNDVIAQAKRVANLNGRAADWWLRSPYTNSSASEWRVGAGGNFGFDLCSSARGVRPAIILPPDLPVEMQEDGSFNIVPNNTSARKIVDGVELPAASLKTVGGIDLECDCYKIIDGIELVCT